MCEIEGNLIVGEQKVDSTGALVYELEFLYDSSGNVLGMVYNGEGYYYEKNLYGDIVGLMDGTGTRIATYKYDSWGKTLRIFGSNAELGKINPFRYRSYYYDRETGLFYLNSRYYDPEVGRFISADTEDVLSADHQNFAQYNLYAYCWNNPVNMSDENGDWPSWATATLGVVGVSLCVAAVAVLSGGVALGPVLGAVVTGAAKGALIGAAVGSAAGAGVGYAKTKTLTGTLKGATIGLGVGAIAGAVIGASSSGLKYAKTNGVSIKKVGKLKSSNHPGDSQWGVKYTVKKANGSSTTRSLEFHYNHKHKGYKLHWQQNKWNTRFNASHGDKYWTWWGKRITNGK